MKAQKQVQAREMLANVYRARDRLTVAALVPGLISSKDISVEVTDDGHLVMHGDLRGVLKDDQAPLERKEIIRDEWSAGPYHRELELPVAVDGELATATYGNGVLVIALPIADQTRPARLSLEAVGPFRGERVGSVGFPISPTTTADHLAARAVIEDQHGGPSRANPHT